MKTHVEYNDIEDRIIRTAKKLFIEKGFTDTSMSEIAATVGINRPVLHYYYRTKEKLFKTVFGMIIQLVLPKVQDIIIQKNLSVSERIAKVVDIYYGVLHENPDLPLFVLREMHRDVNFLIETIMSMQMKETSGKLLSSIQEEMEHGAIRAIPLKILFLTFYSLLTYPFLTRKFNSAIFLKKDETFDTLLEEWKPYMIAQMECLLCVDK